jgi:hypothetical protein
MAASLADEVNVKSASSRAGQAATSHVGWLLKWVLLGNVVFLAIWVIYPGWFLLRFAASIERALYDAYQAEPLEVKVDVGTGNNQIIHATPALSADAVVQASRSGLTLLGVYTLPLAQSETTEGDDLRQGVATQVRTAAQQLLQHGAAVFWCNLAQSYPTHYQDVAALLPARAKQNGTWVALREGQVVCAATTCSEAIAKALGVPAGVRAIDHIVVGTNAADLQSIRTASQERPILAFTYGGGFGPTELVKNSTSDFLRAVAARGAAVFWIKLTKKGTLGEDLQKHNVSFTGCAIWHKGEPVKRIKMGWFSSATEDIKKVTAWLLSDGACGATERADSEHKYRTVPCYIYSEWQQVLDASTDGPVILASGARMDTKKAEAAFLHRLGSVITERGYRLAVAPIEGKLAASSVASGLRAARAKPEGCCVVRDRKVVATIAKSPPQTEEDGWLDAVVKYLVEAGA